MSSGCLPGWVQINTSACQTGWPSASALIPLENLKPTPKQPDPSEWLCKSCNRANKWDAIECGGCRWARTFTKETYRYGAEWQCPQCDAINYEKFKTCQNCGYKK